MQHSSPGLKFDWNGIEIAGSAVNEPVHPLTAQLLAHWIAKSEAGRPMAKTEIACRETTELLPFLFLMEPTDAAGSDWRNRLIGAGIAERLGGPDRLCSSLFEQYRPEIADMRARNYRRVVSSGRPIFMRGRFLNIGRDFHELEITNLPVSAGDATWILGGVFFFE
jgi:hypothetical protein